MRTEHLEALSELTTFILANAQHHLGIFINDVMRIRLAQGIVFQHIGRTLNLECLFERIVGFDITTMQRLAVVAR